MYRVNLPPPDKNVEWPDATCTSVHTLTLQFRKK